MKFQKIIFVNFLLLLLLSLSLHAQIPNGGFENWTLGDPDLWYTNNVISLKPITQSGDAYSGNSSVQLRVLYNTIPYGATLYSGENGEGFPVNQRYTNLSGYFKYFPQPNTIFHFTLGMYRADTLIGVVSSDITTQTSSWTPFNIPIVYFQPGDPDSCFLGISLTSPTDTGAVAYLDELTLSGTTGIAQYNMGPIATQFELKQNYPNPFNPTTNIEFSISKSSKVKLVVYNQLGQTVAMLVNEQLSAGTYSADWNAEGLPSGVYFYRITSGVYSESRKMILLQ